jgi:hypothetical protein
MSNVQCPTSNVERHSSSSEYKLQLVDFAKDTT